jgi:predicted sugar kinase
VNRAEVRIRCGGRVQLGFFPYREGFVGLGVALSEPSLAVRWTATAGADGRAIQETLAQAGWATQGGIRYEATLWRHVGLGSGTIRALAGAETLCRASGLTPTIEILHQLLRPQARTAVGRTLYEFGGAVWSEPERTERAPWPASWALLLACPTGTAVQQRVHGAWEAVAVERIQKAVPQSLQDEWHEAWHEVWESLQGVPALDRFAHAFQAAQQALSQRYGGIEGMPALHPLSKRVLTFWAAQGWYGAQSSWGPMVYAIGPFTEMVAGASLTRHQFGAEVWVAVTTARAHGRLIEEQGGNTDGAQNGGGH